MKVLLGKIGFLAALVILTCSIVLVAAGWRKNDYVAATIDKHKLLKETRSPKLILVGGSAVAFALDSEMIQRQLGASVINMGLHFSTGLGYMLEEVKPYIGTGDLVIVMPEYEQFCGDSLNGDGSFVWELISYVPEELRNLRSLGQYIALLKGVSRYLNTRFVKVCKDLTSLLGIHEFEPPLYRRSSFNDHGDFVAHLSLARQLYLHSLPTRVPDEVLNEETFSVLEGFSRYAASKKARVVVVWPSIPEPLYFARKEWIQGIVFKMTEYPGIVVKGTPSDYVLPVDNFFDTIYHLNAEGRRKETLKVLNFLSNNEH